MPVAQGQREGEGHREALLPRTSSDSARDSSARPSPLAPVDAVLPNTITSGSTGRLAPQPQPDPADEPQGAAPHWAAPVQPPLSPVGPTPARFGSRHLAPVPPSHPPPPAHMPPSPLGPSPAPPHPAPHPQPPLPPSSAPATLPLEPHPPSTSTAPPPAPPTCSGPNGGGPPPAPPPPPPAPASTWAPHPHPHPLEHPPHPLEPPSAPSPSYVRYDSCGGGFAPECRICLLAEPVADLLAAPCHCTGSLAYAHLGCLRKWVMEKRSVHCELCGTMYKEPYGSDLAASIPPAPQPQPRRITSPDGQPIIIMPMGVGLGPGAMGPLLQHPGMVGPGGAMVAADPRDLEPQPLCEWRNMWSYVLILMLLLFAIIYVTVISKRGKQEPWMMTLWQVLLVVLPIYLVLRVAFDLYRHRLAQQLAAANLQAMAMANAAVDAAGHGHGHGGPREVIITRAGNRVLVLQRAGP